MAEDWRAEYETRKAAEELHARRQLGTALDLFARLGVRTVSLMYDGGDGAGSLYGVAFDPMPPAGIPEGLAEVVRASAYWLLPAGWEIDDGSYGPLTIDVATRKAHRGHHRRIRSSEDNVDLVDL
jgi:hypothetical protein